MGWNNTEGSIVEFGAKHTLGVIEQAIAYLKMNVKAERAESIKRWVEYKRKCGKTFFWIKYDDYTELELEEMRAHADKHPFDTFQDSWGDDRYSRIKYRAERQIDKLNEIYQSIKASITSSQSDKLWLDKDDANMLSYYTIKEYMSDRFADFIKNKGKTINVELSSDSKQAFYADE